MSRKPAGLESGTAIRDLEPAEAIAAHEAKAAAVPEPKPFDYGPRIPCSVLRFHRDVDMPGKGLTSTVTATGDDGRNRWRIDYLPRVQMFEVRFSEPNGKEHVRMVPREWAQYTPA